MEFHHTEVGTIVQSKWWVQCTHVHVVYHLYMVINMAFHTQHHDDVHIYMNDSDDTNIADGVDLVFLHTQNTCRPYSTAI